MHKHEMGNKQFFLIISEAELQDYCGHFFLQDNTVYAYTFINKVVKHGHSNVTAYQSNILLGL